LPVLAVAIALLPAIAAASGSTDGGTLSLKLSGALDTSLAAIPRASPDVAAPPVPAVASASAQSVLARSRRDYRIGVEDLLDIQVFGVEQLTRTVRVNSRGEVSLPLVGTLHVGGLTAQGAENLVRAKLAANYLQDPQVSLFIKEYTSQRVTIEGAVNKPGVYPLRGPTTLLQSLAVAGGQANLSDMTEVMLFRSDDNGKRETLVYDVDRIRSGELEDPTVLNEDLIVVKRSKARVIFKDSILRDLIDTVNPFR
jgi:polysaccharide export outer membrane protein